jgi:hypothetical protein
MCSVRAANLDTKELGMERKAVRQGDILVVPIERDIQGDAVAAKKGKLVVAEGELTGHHHFVKASSAVVLTDDGVDKFIEVQEAAQLKHQTHRALHLPEGNSVVIQQRRVTPGSDHMVRAIYD